MLVDYNKYKHDDVSLEQKLNHDGDTSTRGLSLLKVDTMKHHDKQLSNKSVIGVKADSPKSY